MLNLMSEDFRLFELAFSALEDLAGEPGDWVPTIILVSGDEKVVISYGESGDPCITEAYDINDKMRNFSHLFGMPPKVQDVH